MSPEALRLLTHRERRAAQGWDFKDKGDLAVGVTAVAVFVFAAGFWLGTHYPRHREPPIVLTQAAPRPVSNVRMECREAVAICKKRAKESSPWTGP